MGTAKRREKLRNLQSHTGIIWADRMRRHGAVHRAGRAERGRARGTKAAVFRQYGSGGCDAETGFDMSPTGIISSRSVDGPPAPIASNSAAGDTRREGRLSRSASGAAACLTPSSRSGRAERGHEQAPKTANFKSKQARSRAAAPQETGPKSSETRRYSMQLPSICTIAPMLKPLAPKWAIKNPAIYETIFVAIFAPEF